MWLRGSGVLGLYGWMMLLVLSSCGGASKKDDVDVVIEDEITQRLAEDLLESIEKKFQSDLERSVDMVLTKIKMLLQNGTSVVQDRLVELQNELLSARQEDEMKLEQCMLERVNETSALAEKALHQMVLCGYALIGHDPAQALAKIMQIKDSIRQGIKPLHEHKAEIFTYLKACGHQHENLKKVVSCVISKSPRIKSSMMEVTSKLIEGVVDLTKLMAHGAMHEACLIEVVKSIEDEAVQLVAELKHCSKGDKIDMEEVKRYIEDGNATVIDPTISDLDQIPDSLDGGVYGRSESGEGKEVKKVEKLLRRLLKNKGSRMDETFRRKLAVLKDDLEAGKFTAGLEKNIEELRTAEPLDNKV